MQLELRPCHYIRKMPRVKGPLFSLSAKGTLAKTLTFKKDIDGTVVRDYVKPKIKFTPAQENRKLWFKRGVWTWRGVTGAYNYWYSDYCQGLVNAMRIMYRSWTGRKGLRGFTLFMSWWLTRSIAGLPQYQHPGKYGFCMADDWVADELICNGYFHSWA